ncbi:hypothetical protein L7F22_041713 [Adiantum nelumboides]|nr:hypothetical protein [Adiantum nelumboides]
MDYYYFCILTSVFETVLSSIEGIELASSSISKSTVIAISVIILVAIFLAQRIGTAGVSFLFSPIMSAWLLTTALIEWKARLEYVRWHRPMHNRWHLLLLSTQV